MAVKTVLVVGGAGFIGSHVAKMLSRRGYNVLVFDNLTTGSRQAVVKGTFIEGDLANPKDLENVFSQTPIDAVMHFAAHINVGESMHDPLKYYRSNVVNTLNLLEAMKRYQVNTLVFSSSAAIFGLPHAPKIAEDAPCLPINPYGQSKLMVEKILADCDRAHGLKFSCLRYFNAAGGDPEKEIKNDTNQSTNLIPILLRNIKQTKAPSITIFGNDYPTPDGTCIRDYIHIEDIGSAHILAMEQLFKSKHSTYYNLGNGNGFSVREVIQAAERVTGHRVKAIEGPRRPGDPAILIADSQKAQRLLGWQPHYTSLDTIILHAWQALN
jgi:UDP-glucose 4-epimerase